MDRAKHSFDLLARSIDMVFEVGYTIFPTKIQERTAHDLPDIPVKP
jgi:hypothetical protein